VRPATTLSKLTPLYSFAPSGDTVAESSVGGVTRPFFTLNSMNKLTLAAFIEPSRSSNRWDLSVFPAAF
jgi:hypothetical protein